MTDNTENATTVPLQKPEQAIMELIRAINMRYKQFKSDILTEIEDFKKRSDLTEQQRNLLKPSFEDHVIDPQYVDSILSINPVITMTRNNETTFTPPFYKPNKVLNS